jgi:large subunit ribosomal protein L35
MPKLKTHKGAASRFHITGSGKIMHSKIGKSHFRRRKPARVKRGYAVPVEMHSANESRVKKMLPYR